MKAVAGTLAAVAYIGAASVLFHVLGQLIETAISYDASILAFVPLGIVFGLLIGRWWAVLLGLAIIPISAPSWEGGCTELCAEGISFFVITPLSLMGLAAGVLLRVLGRRVFHLSTRETTP